jgi:hypothetical protein
LEITEFEMANNSATIPTATADASRFVTEKVSEEGGLISGSAGGSPASKHSSTGGGGSIGGGGGGTPQATNKGGVPDGNCPPSAVPQKGKARENCDLEIMIRTKICGFV